MDLTRLFAVLHAQNVEFVVVGDIASRIHGSARDAESLELVYSRSDANIARVVKALVPFNPYPNGAPPNLPFDWSAKTIKAGLNFTLSTTLGAIDILGEVIGGGCYEDLVGNSVSLKLFGQMTHVVSLPWLIRLKRAAGRVRDFAAIAELELLQELEAKA